MFRRLGVFAGSFPLDAAEAVVAAPGDIDRVEVLDVLSRLVDKSLVVADDGAAASKPATDCSRRCGPTPAGPRRRRALVLRDAHASWWTDWLEPRWRCPPTRRWRSPTGSTPTSSPRSTGASPIRLTAGAAHQPREDLDEHGRAGYVLAAADALLTDANAAIGTTWVTAALEAAPLVWMARGFHAAATLLERVGQAARAQGDPYYAARAWDRRRVEGRRRRRVGHGRRSRAARRLPRGGDHRRATASHQADADPTAGGAPARPARAAHRGVRPPGSTSLASRRRWPARSTGDLRVCIDLATDVLEHGTPDAVTHAVNLVSTAGLLALGDHAPLLRLALARARRCSAGTPGWASSPTACSTVSTSWTVTPARSIATLVTTDPVWPLTSATLWVLAPREVIDAGVGDTALERVPTLCYDDPHGRVVMASITGAATVTQDVLHTALEIAAEKDLRLIVVDALEGLAVAPALEAASTGRTASACWPAADRLRDELGYRWRFPFEQSAIDAPSTCSPPPASTTPIVSRRRPTVNVSTGGRPPPSARRLSGTARQIPTLTTQRPRRARGPGQWSPWRPRVSTGVAPGRVHCGTGRLVGPQLADAVGVRAPVPADRRAVPTDRRADLRGLGPALGVVLPPLAAAVGRHVEQARETRRPARCPGRSWSR